MSETYRAVAEREDGWWIITIAELDVVTQARRIDQIEHMARDLISVWLEVDYDAVAVDVEVRVPESWRKEAAAVDHAQELAAAASAEAARTARRAAKRLHAQGITVRDIGQILGVSPQRVSQLLKAAKSRAGGGEVVDMLDALTASVDKDRAQSKRRGSTGRRTDRQASGS